MSYYGLVLADNPSLYFPLNADQGMTDQSGNGRDGSLSTPSVNIGGYPVTPKADYTSLFSPGNKPLLHDTYAGKGTTALTTADTGQSWDTSQFTNDANTRMSIVSNKLTFASTSGSDLRAYAQANIGNATRLGSSYTFSSGSTNGGVMAILAGRYIDLSNRYGNVADPFGWTLNVHWTVDPDSWEYVFVLNGTIFTALTGTHSLTKDDTTVYTSALVRSGQSIWIRIPDGSYRVVSQLGVSALQGDWVIFEATQGTPATDDKPKFTEVWADTVPAEIDSSTDLNGTDHAVLTTYNPFTIGSRRTFECWAYRDSSSSGDVLFGNSVAVFAGNFLIRLVSGSNDVEWFLNFVGVGGADGTWTAAWPGNGQWVHMALVVDDSANTAELYINGVSKGSQAFAWNSSWNASPGVFYIGAWDGGADWFDGKLSHVAVYERALTASEIKAHYGAMQVDAQIQPGYLTTAGRGQ